MSLPLVDDTLADMTAARRPQLLTVEEYLASEATSPVKREYVGGYVYEIGEGHASGMAGGRNTHQFVASNFLIGIGSRLRGTPCQALNSDAKLRVRLATHTRFYYPDVMVVCEANPADETFQDRPVIIAEVLSPSTRRTDTGEKLDAYRAIPSLMAYLLVETDAPRVTVHRRVRDQFVAETYDGLDAVIPLDALGTTLPLAELYERVDFTPPTENAAEAERPVSDP